MGYTDRPSSWAMKCALSQGGLSVAKAGLGQGWGRGRGWGRGCSVCVYYTFLVPRAEKDQNVGDHPAFSSALTLPCLPHQSPSLGLSSCRTAGWRGSVQSCSGERLLGCELLPANQYLITRPGVPGGPPRPKQILLLIKTSDMAFCGEGTFHELGMLVARSRGFTLLLRLPSCRHFLWGLHPPRPDPEHPTPHPCTRGLQG